MSAGAVPLVRASGTVPWRPGEAGEPEVALVHRPRFDDWSLPKGKLDPGEAWKDAAARETEEEAGLVGILGPELCGVAYQVAQGPKLVRYWLLLVTGEAFVPNGEVDAMMWRPLAEATRQAQYRGDRAVLRSASAVLEAAAASAPS